MSEYEHVKGKIQKIKFLNCDFEENCRQVLLENDIVPDPDYSGDEEPYQMQLDDELYKEVIIYNNNLYKVIESEDVDDYDIFEASVNKDMSINFEVCFYNVGCSFEEAIGIAIDKMIQDDINKPD